MTASSSGGAVTQSGATVTECRVRRSGALVLTLLAGVCFAHDPAPTVTYESAMERYRAGDHVAALAAFRELAEAGNERAAYALGDMIANGEGVDETDPVLAATWMRRAAEGLVPAAAYHLGLMYARGSGVEQDPVEAWYWLRLAGAQGYRDADDVRSRLESLMSSAQLAEGRGRWDEAGYEPPRPLRHLHASPTYPELPRLARIQSNVILQARILEDGTVGDIEVLRTNRPNMGFEQAAVDAVKQWRYEPARRGGVPILIWFTVYVEFKLHDPPGR